MDNNYKPKVGLISLTEIPRAISLVSEREKYIEKRHNKLLKFLIENNINVVDVEKKIKRVSRSSVSICLYEDIQKSIDLVKVRNLECIIIGLWKWADPMTVVRIVREVNIPTILYTEKSIAWPGTCGITAAGGSLWETAPNSHAITHNRIYGDKNELLKCIKGICSIEKLKKGTLILWGGSYAAKIEYTQDDYPKLKSFLIGDIENEGQYILIEYAKRVSKERIKKFKNWFISNGGKIDYDNKVLTPEIFKKSVALYLGAKDRIKEYKENVIGVSIKCFYELSDFYGVDGCFLPAFLPYHEDSEGQKTVMPTVCEGDIKALISSILLTNISGGVPALFGDVTYIDNGNLIISNCGASSIYYACKDCKTPQVLSNIIIAPNCEGKGGGAVGYRSLPGKMTVIRLLRVKGKYYMHVGLANAVKISKEVESRFVFGKMWPHTAIDLGVDERLIVSALGSNHLIAIYGDYLKDVCYACREAGIKVFRIDSNESLKEWIDYSALL